MVMLLAQSVPFTSIEITIARRKPYNSVLFPRLQISLPHELSIQSLNLLLSSPLQGSQTVLGHLSWLQVTN